MTTIDRCLTTDMTGAIHCVDLFCGVGGLTHGLMRRGIKVTYGIDVDPNCCFPYEENNKAKFIESGVENLSGNSLLDLFGASKHRLLAGCAPCQPFSTYSRKGRGGRNDREWELIAEFGRLIVETEPEFITMENVPQLVNHKVFQDFLKCLTGYHIWYEVINCTQYGIPQTRKRLVLLASRLGPINLISPVTFGQGVITVREAIAHLKPLSAGETDPQDPLHTAAALSKLNLRRIRASKPGGTWRDWEDELRTLCHRKGTGQSYPSVYGRMKWNTPSPTITTQCFGYGNGRFGHPEQDRAISLREAAILQTFPEDYRFVRPGERASFSVLGRLIGNAVPVRIGEAVAQSLIEHVKQYTLMTA